LRWSRDDDEQVAREAQLQAVLDHTRQSLADFLGLELEQIELIPVRAPRPCRHWRCRIRRWWHRHGQGVLSAVVLGSAVLSTVALLVLLVGVLTGEPR